MKKKTIKLDQLDKNTQFLTLLHYKEPLIKAKGGFGYVGALSVTVDGKLAQCHECGKLFENLGAHVHQAHMPVIEYKDKWQLAHTTALTSENERKEQSQRTSDWWNALTKEERDAFWEKRQKGYKEWIAKGKPKRKQPKGALETKNKDGTCPDQLLDRIKAVKEKVGRTPSVRDMLNDDNGSQRYLHLIRTTFGSWKNALKMLGMKPRVSAKEQVKGKRTPFYTNEELLEYLRVYYQENNQLPTESAFKRGLLPSSQTYIRRFGSIVKARHLAGLE